MSVPVQPPDEPSRRAADVIALLLESGAMTPELWAKLVDHQTTLERSQLRLEWAGLLAAWSIALCFLIVSGLLIADGHDVAGTILGSVDLVGLVAVFLAGRRA